MEVKAKGVVQIGLADNLESFPLVWVGATWEEM